MYKPKKELAEKISKIEHACILYQVYGYSFKEIAEKIGVTKCTVSSWAKTLDWENEKERKIYTINKGGIFEDFLEFATKLIPMRVMMLRTTIKKYKEALDYKYGIHTYKYGQ